MEKYCFLGAGALPCFLLQVPIDLCNQREFCGLLEGAPCLGYKDKRRNSSYHPLSMNTPHLIKWGKIASTLYVIFIENDLLQTAQILLLRDVWRAEQDQLGPLRYRNESDWQAESPGAWSWQWQWMDICCFCHSTTPSFPYGSRFSSAPTLLWERACQS